MNTFRFGWVTVILVAACSDNGTNQPSEPTPLRFSSISVATGVTCGVTSAGTVYCWGSGAGGIFSGSLRPLQVQSPATLTSVSLNSSPGSAYACGLDGTGAPYCWGTILVDSDSLVGLGQHPTALPGGVQLTSISAGVRHICGVTVTHVAYCWGDFEGGRRGDGTISFDTSAANFEPNVVFGGFEFTQVIAGTVGSCGLTTQSQAYCWGSNYLGYLGNPDAQLQQNCGLGFPPCALTPVPVAGGHFFDSISGSSQHACGVSGSQVFCWGLDDKNQIGTDQSSELCDSLACVTQPFVASAFFISLQSVSAGGSSTCAFDTDNVPYCWGDNSFGQIGNNNRPSAVPSLVAGRHQFTDIAVASDHTCALVRTGEAFCWGSNSDGQLGTGDQTNANTPIAVVGPASPAS